MNFGRLSDISVKWKLLIPFLFLAAMGAIALFLVSYRFQAGLIHENEGKRLNNQYQYFLTNIDLKTKMAMSLSYLVAEDPHIAEAFAKRDRKKLIETLHPAYLKLHESFGVKQFHFHEPPAKSFLRLHALDDYGQEMEAYRATINKARETGIGVGGLEWGVFGFGIRSVVPVFHQGIQVGTVEFGLSFQEPLLKEFKKNYGSNLTLYVLETKGVKKPKVFASTVRKGFFDPEQLMRVFDAGQVMYHTSRHDGKQVAVIAGPVRDFSSKIVAAVEISVDRGPTLALLRRYGSIALAIGLIGFVISISFVWFISSVFTKRIEEVVEASEDIAAGHRDTRIRVKGADEISTMAKSINEMLASLEGSRRKVKTYADNLELMVEERTRSLRESEQNYKSLVEHVPLLVYFVTPDGTATLLNRFSEQLLGVAPKKLSGHRETWANFIHPHDRTRVLAEFQKCLNAGKEYHAEYRMVRDNRVVYVFDHALPVFGDGNRLIRMDGIILDVSARKELQEKILQAEELETLSEVSARLAHEIRNPLTSIGGLTRRLARSFDLRDPRKKKGDLIVEEVGKLEKILTMMTAYIEPTSIAMRPCDLNQVVTRAIQKLDSQLEGKNVTITSHLDESLDKINLDCALFEKILISLMGNAFFRMKQEGEMEVVTGKDGGYAVLTLAYRMPFVSDDDIDHFFYPFVVSYPFPEESPNKHIMDIPICRVLIHKHGGIINVSKEKHDVVKITISLPYE